MINNGNFGAVGDVYLRVISSEYDDTSGDDITTKVRANAREVSNKYFEEFA